MRCKKERKRYIERETKEKKHLRERMEEKGEDILGWSQEVKAKEPGTWKHNEVNEEMCDVNEGRTKG